MNNRRAIVVASLFFFLIIAGCGPKQIYLVKPPIGQEKPDILNRCLARVLWEVNSGAPPLSPEQMAPLHGIQTEYFLWWDSLSGPKPVVNRDGSPGEARVSVPWPDSSREISDRYVLCLLANGYQFPDEDWVKARRGETNRR